MWVKLLRSKVIRHTQYKKGDWVEVGNDSAANFIANGDAESFDYSEMLEGNSLHCFYPQGMKKAVLPFPQIKVLPDVSPDESADFDKALILNSAYHFKDASSPSLVRNPGQLAILFRLLTQWDVVLILASTTITAQKVAAHEHERTRELVHDLRILYYQSCAIGINGERGRHFISVLEEENGYGKLLAPLRALWRVKPKAYFLPPHWGKL